MNDLERKLKRLIALSGPISVEHYMAAALADPEHGYYRAGDPFGAAGDFVTAPEISQMFGELIGLWCAITWREMGEPERILLAELGPGRGTLMADALRAARRAPAFAAALEVHLIETSPALRRLQTEALAGQRALWHTDLSGLPDGPLLLIANEFFDALPIRQLVRTERGWCERLITADGEDAPLRFVVAPGASPWGVLLTPEVARAGPGSLAELCPAALALAARLAERIERQGGAALIVDYGHAMSRAGETLQAVMAHRPHPALADPGEADLSAHVDFAQLARAAREAGAHCYGPVPQGEFLQALGIEARALRLAESASDKQRRELVDALERLTGARAMGSLFKAFAIVSSTLPAPAGFEGQATSGTR
ncbi:MAG TPA: SAM-dependent methyltransferase [Alphaproteobacteria bacterium]|nr:SAM-dependent methyltransferase [Alphaproteobacteria bacterium]